MSTAVKVLVAIIVLAGLGWLAWWGGWVSLPGSQPATTTQTATTTQQQPQAQAPIDGMSSNNDASDAAITQDTAAVDAQMQGLTTDSSNIDSSLSDTPGPQTY